MDVEDYQNQARRDRAEKLIADFRTALPEGVDVVVLDFDKAVRKNGEAPADPKVGETDLGGALSHLTEQVDLGNSKGVLILTDGGDERLSRIKTPAVPTAFIGIGSDPAGWTDLAISHVDVPEVVEAAADFEIGIDLVARNAGQAFSAEQLRSLELLIEKQEKGEWVEMGRKPADLSNDRAKIRFLHKEEEVGIYQYRVTLTHLNGELSDLNNRRTVTLDVQKRSLHVLYYTQRLGLNFKMMRAELARDPAITFTALYRTIGERYAMQGDRLEGDQDMESGFPTDRNVLKLYDVIVIGSFNTRFWEPAQLRALRDYVNEGGAVIFLGGPDSFGRGGFADTAIAPLFPWRINSSAEPAREGDFNVSIPLNAAGHPAVKGLNAQFRDVGSPSLASVDDPGTLRTAAVALMNASVDDRNVALVAAQPYGSGQTMGVATNTMWKWSRKTPALREAYSLFWRQSVRAMSDEFEGGKVLAVKWNQKHFRPGELGVAQIRVAGKDLSDGIRLTASLADEKSSESIPVEPVIGQAAAYESQLHFKRRGQFVFRLIAYKGEAVLETYEKTLRIAPMVEEGASLELDEAFLQDLARQCDGEYAGESRAEELIQRLATQIQPKKRETIIPITRTGPWFAILFVLCIVAELSLRRRYNFF
jgi:uncharacterized membrane protein